MPKREDLKSILLLGSGPIVIGQACEFDYSGTQAVRALKERGDECGVCFPYIGVYPRFIETGVEWREEERLLYGVVDRAELLGAGGLKIFLGAGLKGGEATGEQTALTAERFGQWYRAARARGLGVCAELHGNTMFDPPEAGEAFMQRYPALDFTICYQPMDFGDTEAALALADRFAGRISHIHLQAPGEDRAFDLLAEGRLDYRRLLPHLLAANPDATMTLEFVKGCRAAEDAFDLDAVLEHARADADFVEEVCGSV